MDEGSTDEIMDMMCVVFITRDTDLENLQQTSTILTQNTNAFICIIQNTNALLTKKQTRQENISLIVELQMRYAIFPPS
jgi:hypothetical protein